ncbi:10518_t:CDS:1, partial [Cetraspora pellucida]
LKSGGSKNHRSRLDPMGRFSVRFWVSVWFCGTLSVSFYNCQSAFSL